MDRLPLIPRNEDHGILPLLTELFQDSFRKNKYPKNIAENYQKYRVDAEFSDLQANGLNTVKILEATDTILDDIKQVEEEIMRNHAMMIIQKDKNLTFSEELKLKRYSLLRKLSEHAVHTYHLIQTNDLYPNRIEQYLDFTCNPFLHTCTPPCTGKKCKTQSITYRKCHKHTSPKANQSSPPFRTEPNRLVFHNYELGRVYTRKFKLRNIAKQSQNFNYYDPPKECPFKVKLLTDSCRLASGMTAEFLVTFTPTSYQNCECVIKFKTVENVDVSVAVSCERESTKLICYVINPVLPWNAVKKPGPGSRYFSERRRDALNFTIDCGTTLLGSHSVITVVMKNIGQKGRFLIATENEWCFSELNKSTARTCELRQGCFTIFPAFFEVDSDEVGEIFVLFVPEKEGMFTEKFYIVCDNNSHQEVEVLGDCVLFSHSFLKVNMYLLENTFAYYQRVIKKTMLPGETSGFIFSVVNNSPLHFTYYWALKTFTDEKENKKMDASWVNILYNTRYIPSFSTTDVVIQVTADTKEEGTYYIYVSLYLKDIPTKCMSDVANFVIIKNEDSFPCIESGPTDVQLADVHIFELGIFCTVVIPTSPIITTVSQVETQAPVKLKPSLRLSETVLHFGVLPIGTTASKCLTIRNLTAEEVNWKLIEIYSDGGVRLCVASSCSKGTLKGKKNRQVAYTVEAKNSIRWFSILCLFSCPTCTCQDFFLEDVCLVTYEVAEIKIVIQADNMSPVLCSKGLIYVHLPTFHTIYIHNAGLVTGCFYFLKPTGPDSEKVNLRFQPQSGVIQSGESLEVRVELVAFESGVFENIYVPCFVGDPDHLISLRVVCAVATINVYFYLPHKDGSYGRFLWPPKKDTPSWDLQGLGEGDDSRVVHQGAESNLLDIIGYDSVAATYPTISTKQIHVKTPTKLTFYIENLTPIQSHFTVEATNYSPDSVCKNHILVKAKTRTPEFFWEKACLAGYGIVVEPELHSGDIVPYEVVQIDLWIYTNTHGKYLEEVMVEIGDLVPFCLNLMIEVVGLPIDFPFARNTTLPWPTLRFENIAHSSHSVTKTFTVTNISAIPVQINWHIFTTVHPHGTPNPPFNFLLQFQDEDLNFIISHTYHGCEACSKCIEVTPYYLILEKEATETVSLTVSASGSVSNFDKTCLKYTLLGFIGLRNHDKFKENYFKRESGVDFQPAKIEVLVTLEMPIMQLDISSDETITDIFVNDILIEGAKFPQVYLLLRNNNNCPVYFAIDIERPFQIIEAKTVPTGFTDRQNLVLQKNECLQVLVGCRLTISDLLDYAELVYKEAEGEKTSVIAKNLHICRKGAPRQMIPFQIRLHYPHIVVKPHFLKFGQCLLYRTKQTIFTIYNLTGSIAKFEIFKTTKNDDIEVRPNYGEIAKSTGLNKQFVDITVYFTPRHCKLYLECLRITTNIPKYYIDLPVTGHGSNNEKFNVDEHFY